MQSIEIVSDADLQVMQVEALRICIFDWLQGLLAEGKSLRPEDSHKLGNQFIDDKLDAIFDILPQPLRESEVALGADVSLFINDLLATELEEKVEVDARLSPHRQIWDAMLAKARLHRGEAKTFRYRSFIDNQGSEKLFTLLEKCADNFIWKNIVVEGKALDPEFLHRMQEDCRYQKSGWYLIFMWDDKHQVWEWYRVYVGQTGGGVSSKTLLTRANEHRSKARSKNTEYTQLLYQVWRSFQKPVDESKMRKVKIIKLGFAPDRDTFPDPGDGDLFLSLGEMYYSLVFRSLQVHDLIKWLPKGAVADASNLAPLGLNTALPLFQGQILASKRAFGKLAHSTDPPVKEHVLRTLKQNLQSVVDAHFAPITIAVRKISVWAEENIFEDGLAGQTVQVKCGVCGWVKIDNTPRYIKRTGQYLSRETGCAICPLTEASKKAKRCTVRKTFIPTDPNLPSERSTLIYKRLGKDGWPQYYKGVRARAPENRRGE